MTDDKDFKAIVRARMRETGQRYTAARADLLAPPDGPVPQTPPPEHDEAYAAAHREHRRVVDRFFDGERLVSIPVKRKVRASILLELVALFEPGRRYSEPEVNHEILGRVHEDYAYLRRELVNYGYLHRDSGIYWLPSWPPLRDAAWGQELPEWEAVWLPGYLAGTERRR
ncbi:DUF2087 domain-containing protein [Arsenicicoccus sp. oral taxon 190]|uniref:DUF2087 domain-containing protein n=1 Tax=Arsenicicoccus sp. oral taxon 190 TaxID=1658671 RepID=UPI000679F1CF|nr:DUF2087 domain-containing protein [Arsenicicoccus sp. oral taxon 190]AKT50400.1 hypothetical protein ADJ73_02015 [Arsenicicoccus sp. oral taxon 190]